MQRLLLAAGLCLLAPSLAMADAKMFPPDNCVAGAPMMLSWDRIGNVQCTSIPVCIGAGKALQFDGRNWSCLTFTTETNPTPSSSVAAINTPATAINTSAPQSDNSAQLV